ncbi:MAG: hypothetical protein ACRD0W_04480 [Acidimicrobiales bacterium]
MSVHADPAVRRTAGGPVTSAEADTKGGGRAAVDAGWTRLLVPVCVAAAILPIVVAVARAIAGDWVPVGDNAYFLIRARDVLTEHHPWLGTWTSASLTLGYDINNPGPLLFDLFAAPAKLGGDEGLVVAVGLVNVAAVLGIVAVARRQAGALGVVAAMVAVAALTWSMGSELLFDPWQPHSLLIPFLLLLILTWGLACGDAALLPWLIGVASLIVQTHIGYAFLVPVIGGAGVAAWGARLVRARRTSPESWADRRRSASRVVAVAAIVAVVCWSQSILEQLLGAGRGNLGRLVSSLGTSQTRVGLARAPRFAADVLALPPWWGRPSMSESFGPGAPLPSLAPSLVGLAAVAAASAVCLARVRRRNGNAAVAAGMALVLVPVSVLAASTMSVGVLGVAAHHVRWLWPVSVFVTFALLLALLASLRGQRTVRAALAGSTGVAVLLGGLALPTMNARVGPSADADSMSAIRALAPQLAALRNERGVLFDVSGLRFAEPFSVPVMAELQRLGVPWFVDDAGMVRQLGTARRYSPGDASVRLFLREGDAARQVPEGARRVAFVDGTDAAEAAELRRVQEDLRPFIAAGGLRLTARARAEANDPTVDNPDAPVTTAELRDPDQLFAPGTASSRYNRKLVYLVEADRLAVAEPWSSELERYADLQQQGDRLTVAVFVEPLVDR